MIFRKISKNFSRMQFRIWVSFFILITLACFALFYFLIRTEEASIHNLQVSHGQILVDQTMDVESFIDGFGILGENLLECEPLLNLASLNEASTEDELTLEALAAVLRIYNWNAAKPYRQLAFVYLPDNGLILDVLSYTAFQDSQEILSRINMSQTSWERLLNVQDEILVDTIYDGEMDFSRLMIAKKIAPSLVLITGIASSDMVDLLKTSQLPDGSQIMLISQSDQAITYASSPSAAFDCPYTWSELQNLGYPDFCQVTLNGTSYYQYHRLLLDGALHQLAFIPSSAYQDIPLRDLVVAFFLLLLLGIPVSFLLSKIVYLPLQRLMTHIAPQKSQPGRENEIKIIEQTIRQLEQKASTYQSQLDLSQKQYDDLLLLRCIKGQCEITPDFFSACRMRGIDHHTENQGFLLAAFRIENVERSADIQGTLENYIDLNTLRVHCEQELSDIPSLLLADGALLLGLFSIPVSGTREIISRLEGIRQSTEEPERPTCSVMVSDTFYELCKIPLAYNQILELLHHMDWSGDYDTLLEYSAFSRQDQPAEPPRDLPSLLQAAGDRIQNGSFQASLLLIQPICDQIIRGPQHFSGNTSIEAAFAGSCLFQAVALYQCKVSDPQKKERIALAAAESDLDSVHSVSQLQRQAEELLEKLCEFETAVSETENLILTAADYIREHFQDPSLSAGEVCAITGMLPSAFSKAFKQCMGVSYLEYLHRLRIDAAKKLLAAGSLTMKEIAEQVGYTNTVTMTRAFKRYENITPGKMRLHT